MAEIVATNVTASLPLERRPNATLTASANSLSTSSSLLFYLVQLFQLFKRLKLSPVLAKNEHGPAQPLHVSLVFL